MLSDCTSLLVPRSRWQNIVHDNSAGGGGDTVDDQSRSSFKLGASYIISISLSSPLPSLCSSLLLVQTPDIGTLNANVFIIMIWAWCTRSYFCSPKLPRVIFSAQVEFCTSGASYEWCPVRLVSCMSGVLYELCPVRVVPYMSGVLYEWCLIWVVSCTNGVLYEWWPVRVVSNMSGVLYNWCRVWVVSCTNSSCASGVLFDWCPLWLHLTWVVSCTSGVMYEWCLARILSCVNSVLYTAPMS